MRKNRKIFKLHYKTPTILTCLGAAGVIATSILSSKATLKVNDLLKQTVEETNEPVIETTAPVIETTEPIETIVSDVGEEVVETTEATESTKPVEVVETVKPTTSTEKQYLGRFKLTAYCACSKCCGQWANGITATGTKATQGRTIAVDPKTIPYGSKVIINGHTYIAEDCGGSIKGNRIDVYFDSHKEALNFGVQYADVYLGS